MSPIFAGAAITGLFQQVLRMAAEAATQGLYSPVLALTLLVTRLSAADNPQNTFATHDFAVTADLFNRSAYFHDLTSIQSNCEQVTH